MGRWMKGVRERVVEAAQLADHDHGMGGDDDDGDVQHDDVMLLRCVPSVVSTEAVAEIPLRHACSGRDGRLQG
jgi:hypothetical protein